LSLAVSTEHPALVSRALNRREALLTLAGIGASAVWAACGSTGGGREATSTGSSAGICVLTPEVTEGPYYIANHLTRRDITENQPGRPLRLHLGVVEATTCKPIKAADVEVWHANAVGVYSGYGAMPAPGSEAPRPPGEPSTRRRPPSPARGGGHASTSNSDRFLRGHQRSDGGGLVVFDTVYPGWYPGRTPGIHVKVHVGGAVVHTGQLFFDDEISHAVYRTAPYKAHGEPDTTNARDSIYSAEGGRRAQLALRRQAALPRYLGAITMGVKS
jgi:protocatechuate 3,4-dioxygenase beta subunit